jgi:hypothetical protein
MRLPSVASPAWGIAQGPTFGPWHPYGFQLLEPLALQRFICFTRLLTGPRLDLVSI